MVITAKTPSAGCDWQEHQCAHAGQNNEDEARAGHPLHLQTGPPNSIITAKRCSGVMPAAPCGTRPDSLPPGRCKHPGSADTHAATKSGRSSRADLGSQPPAAPGSVSSGRDRSTSPSGHHCSSRFYCQKSRSGRCRVCTRDHG